MDVIVATPGGYNPIIAPSPATCTTFVQSIAHLGAGCPCMSDLRPRRQSAVLSRTPSTVPRRSCRPRCQTWTERCRQCTVCGRRQLVRGLQRLVELLELVNAVVAHQSLPHKQREIGLVYRYKLRKSAHQRGVVLHSARSVHEYHVCIDLWLFGIPHRLLRNTRGIFSVPSIEDLPH